MCTADFEKLWVANLRVSLKKAAQTLFVFLSEKKTKLCICIYLIIMGLLVSLGIGWVDTI